MNRRVRFAGFHTESRNAEGDCVIVFLRPWSRLKSETEEPCPRASVHHNRRTPAESPYRARQVQPIFYTVAPRYAHYAQPCATTARPRDRGNTRTHQEGLGRVR